MAVGAPGPEPRSGPRPVELAPRRDRCPRRRRRRGARRARRPATTLERRPGCAPGRAAHRRPPDRGAGLQRGRRPQPGPAGACGVRAGRVGDRRPRTGSGPRRASGARPRGGGRPATTRTSTRARIWSRCWRRPGPRGSGPIASRSTAIREVPDGTDFYAPVTGLFRADPTRTDEPALDALRRLVRPGETWLDIGAGRRPIRPADRRGPRADRRPRHRARSVARDARRAAPSSPTEHAIANVRVVGGALAARRRRAVPLRTSR